MAKQTINVGTNPNDGTGDPLRVAGQKINSNFTEVYALAQDAFNQANTATAPDQASFDTANSAYAQANTGTTLAQAGFNKANTANTIAQAGYDQANTANTTAQSGFDKANTANTTAQSGFDRANTANTIAQAGYDQANTANTTAQSGFDKANTVLIDTNASGISMISPIWSQLQYDPSFAFDSTAIANGSWLYVDSTGLIFESNTSGNIITSTIGNNGTFYPNTSINFGQNNNTLGAPAANGANDKITLWDFQGGGSGFNYAIGAEGNHMWFTMDVNNGTGGFKFYSRDDEIFKIRDDGALLFVDSTVQTTAGAVPGYKNLILVNTSGLHNAANTNEVLMCDPNAAGADINIILPDTTGLNSGKVITVKNINTGANVVLVQPNGGSDSIELLNGTVGTGLYETLSGTGNTVTWIWDSSCWRIISSH